MKKQFILTLVASMIAMAPCAAQEAAPHQGLQKKVELPARKQLLPARRVKKNVPQADIAAYQGRTFYGALNNSDAWDGVGIGSVPYGVYTFTMGSEADFQPVSTNLVYNFMASAFSRDCLYGVQALSIMGALNGARYQALDAENFNTVWEEMRDGSYGIIPSVMAYDPTCDKTYAAMYNDELNGLNWAVFNKTTRQFDILHKWTNDFQPLTLAATPDGQFYCIDGNGYLYMIDKTNGEAEMVGETGVQPTNYVQAMGYDGRTAKFVWQAVDVSGSNLYAVDPVTASAELIERLSKNEQVSSLFFKENAALDKAPAAIDNLRFEFTENGGTTGYLRFTIPAKSYDGESMMGQLKMDVWLDGEKIKDNVGALTGQSLKLAVDLTNDNHYAYVVLRNDVGSSPLNYVYAYAGYDVPKAVTGVTLAVENGQANLTWTAPEGGVNNGYIDFDHLTYKVVRMPDNVVVAESLSGTAFSETLPTKMERYYYLVAPVNGEGKQGEFTESNRILAGESFGTPYFDDFSDESTQSLWTIVDNNNDTYTWTYNLWSAAMSINTISWDIEVGCDDWLVSPGIALNPGITYAYIVNMRNTFANYPERVKLLIGTDPSDLSTFTVLDENNAYDVLGNATDWECDFQVEAEGTYYFAIQCGSLKADNCSGLFVNSVSVEALGANGAPAEVTNLAVTPEESGEMEAVVSFTAPVNTLGGEPLAGNISANIYRDDAETAIHTLTDITPGAEVAWTDNTVQGVGKHKYTVAPANAEGEGKKVSQSAFIGVFTPTYSESFDTESSAEFYTTQANIGTEAYPTKWTWQSYSQNLGLSASLNPGSHVWLYLPAIKLDAESVYEFSFIWNHNVWDGTGADAFIYNGMQPDSTAQALLAPLPYTAYGANLPVAQDIVTTEAGKYYPSIFIEGSKDFAYAMPTIDDVVVKFVASAFAPYAVENLKAEADQDGQLLTNLSFTAPVNDYAGRALEGNMKVDIFRGDNAIPVQTFNDVKPGDALSWQDQQPLHGFNNYLVVATNDKGRGKAVTDTVYVGVDVPNAVDNFAIVGSDDNQKAILSWEAPTEGIHGGVLDASLVYMVFEYFPENPDETKISFLTTDLKDLSYVVSPEPTDKQTVHYYGVMAATSAGYEMIKLDYVVLGKPYDLPFTESFANGAETSEVWMAGGENTSYAAWVEAQDDANFIAQDGDNGYARYYNGSYYGNRLMGELVTPKFKLDPEADTLTFAVYRGLTSTNVEMPCLLVEQNINDGAFEAISDTIFVAGDGNEPGWYEFVLPMKTYQGANFSTLKFKGFASNMNELVLIDNIRIVGKRPTDGIRNMELRLTDGDIYDLSGRKVPTTAPKGVYIIRKGEQTRKVTVK